MYDNDTLVSTVAIATANTPTSWNPPDGYRPADGTHVFTLKPVTAGSTATGTLSLMGSDYAASATLKVVALTGLPSASNVASDSAYYIVHDTQAAIAAAGTEGSALAALMTRGHLIGAFSKDGTAPTNYAATTVMLANSQSVLILGYDSSTGSTTGTGTATGTGTTTGTGTGTTTGTSTATGLSLTLNSAERTIDEDLNFSGRRIAPLLEAGPNVVSASGTGSDQLTIQGLTSSNVVGGSLKVSVTAAAGGTTSGLNLFVTTLSGVFKVNGSTGAVDYYADSRYYGSTVQDSAGNVLHQSGDPAQYGSTGLTVATIDSTLNGKNGAALKLSFTANATPDIVEQLASHIGLQVVDSAGNYTQDWSAAAGSKTVSFELASNVSGQVATASRSVSVVSHEENGQPFLAFLKVIRDIDEDANNSGRLVAFKDRKSVV